MEKKLKLQSLGIKWIATSLTSLVDDTNVKCAKGKQKSQTDNDVDYVPCCNDADEEQDHAKSNDEVFAENIYVDTHGVLDEQQDSNDDYDHINFEIEGVDQETGTRHIMDVQNLSSGNQVGGNEKTRPINPVYPEPVFLYPKPVYTNSKAPCKIVQSWGYLSKLFLIIKPDSRHKLKHKYFDNPKLKTKADWMKNRPAYMLDADWKYLVNLRSSPEFQKEKYGRECARLDLMLKSRMRTSDKPANAENLTNNMHAKVAMEKLKNEREQGLNDKTDEQIFQEVLGKDRHGYLSSYGKGKSITDYFGVKPSRLDLAQDVMELKKEPMKVLWKLRKM
ncbi:hypothetical protein Cgig2_017081 [Carnegiea gigantea]|uniref:Transposase, Ptta/En/Spm, plant n=1 Tax=Carnegiea gigantea TaxID=171969 RepID=A0A9Q1Q6H5_9CARY|nr:hypothetical protein Cgig2_017081 [Carnegiea gigantea]